MRAASRDSNRSRTTARAMTMPALTAARLQEAHADQRVDVGRQRTGDRGRDVENQSDIQRRLAPESIGKWSVQQLRESQCDEECGERKLDRPGLGVKLSPERGQARQIHID